MCVIIVDYCLLRCLFWLASLIFKYLEDKLCEFTPEQISPGGMTFVSHSTYLLLACLVYSGVPGNGCNEGILSDIEEARVQEENVYSDTFIHVLNSLLHLMYS